MDPSEYPSLEGLHSPDDDPFWQESWYFNFADRAADVFGLIRIGMRPARGRADGLALCSRAGRPVLLYPALGLSLSSARVSLEGPEHLVAGRLSLSCEEPMDSWRIRLSGRRSGLDLAWKTMTPLYVFPSPSAGEGKSAAREHYEQAGRVTGELRLGKESIEISGLGQRDHSWGPRNWAGVGAWTWISAQFQPGFAFNFWSVGSGSEVAYGGFFADDKEAVAVTGGSVSYEGDPGGRRHSGGMLSLKLSDGREKEVSFTPRAFWPLYKDGAMIYENFGLFSCDGAPGVGVTEVLARSRFGPLPALGHAPRFAALALRSL